MFPENTLSSQSKLMLSSKDMQSQYVIPAMFLITFTLDAIEEGLTIIAMA